MARRPGISRKLGLAVLFLLVAATGGAAAPAQGMEYRIKAVFLFNFVQFVRWPDGTFPNPDSPLRVGVLGDDPFRGALEQTMNGERVGDRKVIVVRSHSAADLADCQLIFVGRSERDRLQEVLANFANRPVLTVGEVPGFAQEGGVINFYLAGNKVRFEINPDAARRDGLRVSSQLLSVGRIVGPARNPGGE